MLDPRLAILFPGVGAQFTGMGADWYRRYPEFRETLDEASQGAGTDLARLCHSPAEKATLAQQLPAQLAIFAHGVAVYRVLRARGLPAPAFMAGHSLGELTALCAAEALPLREGAALVRERGAILQQVAAHAGGTMAWVLNLPAQTVENVCASLAAQGSTVSVSSSDAPTQVTVSGTVDDVAAAAPYLEKAGATVYPLPLSGPFHSPLMAEATRRMEDVLADVPLARPAATVLANRDARPHAGGAASREQLARQLSEPLQWTRTVAEMQAAGVGVAVEVGPKGILASLVARNTPRMRVWVADRHGTAEQLLEAMDAAALDPAALVARCLRAALTSRAHPHAPPEPIVSLARELERLGAAAAVATQAEAARALSLTAELLRAKGCTEADIRIRFAGILDGRLPLEARA